MDIEKELDSESVNYKKFLKTKIKSYSEKVTDFYSTKIPKVVVLLSKKVKTIICKCF